MVKVKSGSRGGVVGADRERKSEGGGETGGVEVGTAERRGCTALRTFGSERTLVGGADSVGAEGEHRVSAVGRSARRLAIKLIGAA